MRNGQKLLDNTESIEVNTAINVVVRIIFFLPRVSAKYPHKCEDTIMPRIEHFSEAQLFKQSNE